MSEAINFYDKLTARIATLALGFDPKGMKPSDIQYKLNYQKIIFSLISLCPSYVKSSLTYLITLFSILVFLLIHFIIL